MEFLGLLDVGLVIKIAATAILVLGATLAAERFGSFIGAIIASMPLSAGPSYLFLALEHDAQFIERSALTSLSVHPMTAILLVICAVLVPRAGIFVALAVALAVWFAGAVWVTAAGLSFPVAAGLNIAIFASTVPISMKLAQEIASRPARRRASDVVLRVVAVACVVGGAVVAGRHMGPRAAGMMALVPVIWISVAVILALRAGPQMCASVLANGVVAMVGFSLAFAVLHAGIARAGLTASLIAALVISVGWNLLLTGVRALQHRRQPAG